MLNTIRINAKLVISEDLDELFVLCDRLGVIYKEQLSPHTSRDEIGRLMESLIYDGFQQLSFRNFLARSSLGDRSYETMNMIRKGQVQGIEKGNTTS